MAAWRGRRLACAGALCRRPNSGRAAGAVSAAMRPRLPHPSRCHSAPPSASPCLFRTSCIDVSRPPPSLPDSPKTPSLAPLSLPACLPACLPAHPRCPPQPFVPTLLVPPPPPAHVSTACTRAAMFRSTTTPPLASHATLCWLSRLLQRLPQPPCRLTVQPTFAPLRYALSSTAPFKAFASSTPPRCLPLACCTYQVPRTCVLSLSSPLASLPPLPLHSTTAPSPLVPYFVPSWVSCQCRLLPSSWPPVPYSLPSPAIAHCCPQPLS